MRLGRKLISKDGSGREIVGEEQDGLVIACFGKGGSGRVGVNAECLGSAMRPVEAKLSGFRTWLVRCCCRMDAVVPCNINSHTAREPLIFQARAPSSRHPGDLPPRHPTMIRSAFEGTIRQGLSRPRIVEDQGNVGPQGIVATSCTKGRSATTSPQEAASHLIK